MPLDFKFDAKNLAAQRVAARQAARLVTRVSKETKAAIKMLITRSIREGIPPYEAARAIRSMVGMTGRQSLAASHFRTELVDQGLTLDRVNKLTDRYVAKKVRERALNIARTEVMGALNRGTLESWGQAQKQGFLTKDQGKEVIVTPDERLCQVCAPMDGVVVPLKESFQTSAGDFDAPGFHPSCRCTMGIAELGERAHPGMYRARVGPRPVARSGPRPITERLPGQPKNLSFDPDVPRVKAKRLLAHIEELPSSMKRALSEVDSVRVVTGRIPLVGHESAGGVFVREVGRTRIFLRARPGRMPEATLRHELAHYMDVGLSDKVYAAWKKDIMTFGTRAGDRFVTHYSLNVREGFAQSVSHLTGKTHDVGEFRKAFKNTIEATRAVLKDLAIEPVR